MTLAYEHVHCRKKWKMIMGGETVKMNCVK